MQNDQCISCARWCAAPCARCFWNALNSRHTLWRAPGPDHFPSIGSLQLCVTVFGSYSLRSTHPCVGRQEPFRDVQIVPKEGCTGCRPGARQGVCLGSADSQNLSGGVRWPAPLCTLLLDDLDSWRPTLCTLLLPRFGLLGHTLCTLQGSSCPYIKFRRFPQFVHPVHHGIPPLHPAGRFCGNSEILSFLWDSPEVARRRRFFCNDLHSWSTPCTLLLGRFGLMPTPCAGLLAPHTRMRASKAVTSE